MSAVRNLEALEPHMPTHPKLVLAIVSTSLLALAPGCTLVGDFGSFQLEDAGTSADVMTSDAAPGDVVLTVDDLLGGSIEITIDRGGEATTCSPSEPCGSILVPSGAVATLRATGDVGRQFRAWSGLCSGESTNVCRRTLSADGVVGAVFDVRQYLVAFDRVGVGTGTIRTTDDRHVCDDTACETFLVPHGTRLEVSAEPAVGSTFAGWDAPGCTAEAMCAIEITAPTTIAADFSVTTYLLDVRVTGTGTVTGVGIGCTSGAGDCSQVLAHGTRAVLAAEAPAGHVFSGWEGCDAVSVEGDCEVTLLSARTIDATFSPLRGVNVSRLGRGTVRSTPAAISCGDGGMCTSDFSAGTMVSLTPIADVGHHFVEWASDCGGAVCACAGTTPLCRFTVGATAVHAAAVFAADAHTITLRRTGSGTAYGVIREGTGDVCSATSCPVVATETGRVHTFTASDDFRASFDGWACTAGDCGACDGATGPCTFTVASDSVLEARFTERRYTLTTTVTARGGADGSTPGTRVLAANETGLDPLLVATGISCGGVGADCTETAAVGTHVTLSLTTPWLRLSTWGNAACSDALQTCEIVLDADTTLAVELEQIGNLAFATSEAFPGDFGGARGIDEARARCEEAARTANLPVAAYRALLATDVAIDRGPTWQLEPGSGDLSGSPARAGWGTGWVNLDGRPIASSVADVARAGLIHPLLSETGELLPANGLAWTGAHGGIPPAGITMPTPLPAGYPAGATNYARCGDPAGGSAWDRTSTPGGTLYGGVGSASLVGSAFFGAVAPPAVHVPVGTGAPAYNNVQPCTQPLHLYCFESSSVSYPARSPAPVPADGIVMFAHRDALMTPGSIGGIAAMDADCALDASTRGLTGRYVAFVSSTTASAMSRVSLTGPVFRPDGWTIVDDVADLASPMTVPHTGPASMLATDAPGGFESNRGFIAMTGFSTGGPGAVASAADNCSDFTSAVSGATTGYGIGDGVYYSRWGREGTVRCDAFYIVGWMCVRAE